MLRIYVKAKGTPGGNILRHTGGGTPLVHPIPSPVPASGRHPLEAINLSRLYLGVIVLFSGPQGLSQVRKTLCFHGYGNFRRCRPHFAASVPSAGTMFPSTVNRGMESEFQPNFRIRKAELHVSVRDTRSSKSQVWDLDSFPRAGWPEACAGLHRRRRCFSIASRYVGVVRRGTVGGARRRATLPGVAGELAAHCGSPAAGLRGDGPLQKAAFPQAWIRHLSCRAKCRQPDDM